MSVLWFAPVITSAIILNRSETPSDKQKRFLYSGSALIMIGLPFSIIALKNNSGVIALFLFIAFVLGIVLIYLGANANKNDEDTDNPS